MRRVPLALLGAALVLSACADPLQPRPARLGPDGPSMDAVPTAQEIFQRYVALGTSNSMGVQSAGITAGTERAAWPAQLAGKAGATFTSPLVDDPGCGPPLVAPLATDLVLVGAFGNDLVTAVMNTCAPLQAGVVLPAGNVAISGADVHDALYSTIESEGGAATRTGTLYSRVLLPGQTQVTAMLAQQPTFVSVELAANDVLPASTGRISAMTPYANWEADYDQVIAAVQSTGARAVLVGLPSDAANFPSIRRARELFEQWPYLLTLGIKVSLNCYFSSNYLFIPGYVLTLMAARPTTATCSDVPGAVDYVLTASDVRAINARMAQINTHIQTQAAANGWAYFSLDAVYGLPKPRFSLVDVLFSDSPFGTYMSLDGVHPNAAGQGLLAEAAAQAIDAQYGLAIP
ncbi:MAG TPA: SGNH/GDSL hydrolase family protein [Gemmatimonadaceae bacterium]|nr:SGNH/GDSL hydrolase family protein [Gemmatimonadaceae bacterium]